MSRIANTPATNLVSVSDGMAYLGHVHSAGDVP
jgi:hypothetical protein